MKPEIKAKWVAALRSGEYEQTTDALRCFGYSHCCLGVLCDLYSKESGVPFRQLEAEDEALPGEDVIEWAGLSENDPVVAIDGVFANLSKHNDGYMGVESRTFVEIAAAIEEQL